MEKVLKNIGYDQGFEDGMNNIFTAYDVKEVGSIFLDSYLKGLKAGENKAYYIVGLDKETHEVSSWFIYNKGEMNGWSKDQQGGTPFINKEEVYAVYSAFSCSCGRGDYTIVIREII